MLLTAAIGSRSSGIYSRTLRKHGLLDINEMGIVESQFGWHIILVSDRTEEKAADLEEIFDKVESDYKRSIAPAPVEYLRQLESAAEIEIVHERYK